MYRYTAIGAIAWLGSPEEFFEPLRHPPSERSTYRESGTILGAYVGHNLRSGDVA